MALQLKLLTTNPGLRLFSGCNKRPITLRSHDDTTHALGPVFNIPSLAAAYEVPVAGSWSLPTCPGHGKTEFPGQEPEPMSPATVALVLQMDFHKQYLILL